MTLVDDTVEWRSALAGDGVAFGALFQRHKPRVRRHLGRLIESTQDVDDALAVVFLEAWRKRASVRIVDGSILPWLLATATNVARNVQRSSRRYTGLLQQLPQVSIEATPVADEDTEALLALRSLPLPDRQVLTLCVLEGWSEGEAAAALGIRPGTVKSRLHRAKKRLAATLRSQSLELQGGH